MPVRPHPRALYSPLSPASPDEAVPASKKTDSELIKQAMLWHERMGHANYHAVKVMPQHSTGMGVEFTNLNVDDMPDCAVCTAVGIDPKDLNEA